MEPRFSLKAEPGADTEIYKMFNKLETETPVGRKKKAEKPS